MGKLLAGAAKRDIAPDIDLLLEISELEKDVQLIIDASDGNSVLCRTAEDMKLKLKSLKG